MQKRKGGGKRKREKDPLCMSNETKGHRWGSPSPRRKTSRARGGAMFCKMLSDHPDPKGLLAMNNHASFIRTVLLIREGFQDLVIFKKPYSD